MEPEQSMMITSAASVRLCSAGGPDSGDVTDTIASTCWPPAGRYSFWYTATVNPWSLIITPCLGSLGRPVVRRERRDRHSHVVLTAGLEREVHEQAGGPERVVWS